MAESRRPILVTGSHRSGSTWVGRKNRDIGAIGVHPRAIRAAPSSRGLCHARSVLVLLCDGSERSRRPAVPGEDPSLFVQPPGGAPCCPRTATSCALGRGWWPLPELPPSASAAAHEGSDRPVLVRVARVDIRHAGDPAGPHPAAFAASLRRLGDRHPFSHFLQQPTLMRDHLAPFERDIEAMQDPHDVLDEAALLWRLLTFMTVKMRDAHRTGPSSDMKTSCATLLDDSERCST